MKRRTIAAVVLLALTACGTPTAAPVPPEVPGPPLPTSWRLDQDVITSGRIHRVGAAVSAYEQTIEVAVDALAGQPADRCSVQLDVSGQQGPDGKVGAKVATSVRGRPALRDGAEAEGPYLMWQDDHHRWITVQCENEATMTLVANQVRPGQRSNLSMPFGLTVPQGYAVSSLDVARDPLQVAVLLDRADRAFDDSLSVTIDFTESPTVPTGAPTTVGGRRVLLSRDPHFPSACVVAREVPVAHVCVGIPPDDTGPYPDRTDDLPVIETLAASLRLADLDDPTTWFAADRALR